jgi:hypothetical protein
MWWITIIVSLLILGQMFLLKEKDDSIDPINKFMIIIISLILYIFTLLIASFNTYFITATIKDYEKGIIIKVETTTIQGADTTKLVKYKYK